MFSKLFTRTRDTRTRTDRTQILVDGFAAQMDAMADSYLDWSLDMADEGLAALYTWPEHSVEETQRVYVVDLFCESSTAPRIR
jgi:hypothetical protein